MWTTGWLVSMVLAGCAGDVVCGPGTHDEDGVCVPDGAVYVFSGITPTW